MPAPSNGNSFQVVDSFGSVAVARALLGGMMEKKADESSARSATANAHARRALAPLAVEPRFDEVARHLMKLGREDERLADQFAAIMEAAGNGRDLIDSRQSELLDKVRIPQSLDMPTAPDWLRPGITAAYMLAKQRLTPRIAAEIIQDPHGTFDAAERAVRSFEPGLVGEFIVEAAAAERSARVAERMKVAVEEFRPMVADLYEDVPAAEIVNLRAAPGSGQGECRACRGGACEPISCWVIIVIIIVIVVTK